jgi:hypothetical protein
MKQKYIIDTFKGLTPLIMIFLTIYYEQTNNFTMITYTAIHGCYGFFWVLKSIYFGDKSWVYQ